MYALRVVGLQFWQPAFVEENLLAAQQTMLDIDTNGVFDLRDSLILSKVLLGLSAFVANLSQNGGLRPSCLVSLDATLYQVLYP